MTAEKFIATLSGFRTKEEYGKAEKFFKGDDNRTKSFGVRFGDVFRTAKVFKEMPLDQINTLLDSEFYEIRMGAVSIMDYKAKDQNTSDAQKEKLYNLYLDRHDRLNNWDFVDRGAVSIIGEYLVDKSRDILYELAKSDDPWKRRTAIVSTHAFIKRGDLDDTFKIAELLIDDEHELINKAVGSWLREAGKQDEQRLKEFLDRYTSVMPRVTLRYALEKLVQSDKKYYMNLKHL